MIRQNRRLDSIMIRGVLRDSSNKLPSWCPNWLSAAMNDEAYNLVFNTLPHGSRVWSWSRTELKLLTVLGFRLGIVANITTSTNATALLITLLHSNSPQSNPEIAHLQPSDTRPIDQSYYNNKSAILNALHSSLNMTRFTFFRYRATTSRMSRPY